MGEKNKKNNGGEKKETKDDSDDVTVVLKTDLHCEGCAFKVIKCLRSFEGVDTATVGDGQKITVVGQIDPIEIREKLEAKTHKRVELISPQIEKLPQASSGHKENKENNGNNKNSKDKAKHKEDNKKKKESNDSSSKDKPDDDDDDAKPKEKELPVTTAVFKVHLHCEGCIHKIYKTVTKTKGYEEIKFDVQKDLVTVTGAMDMQELAELLQKQLKKEVQTVQPKKDGGKKEKDNGGGDKGSNNHNNEKIGDANVVHAPQIGYPNPAPFVYGSDPLLFNPYTVGSYHAPQIFSDENPNACSVM